MGSVVAPVAGAQLLALQLPTVTILGLLAIPSVISTVGVALMRSEWQAH